MRGSGGPKLSTPAKRSQKAKERKMKYKKVIACHLEAKTRIINLPRFLTKIKPQGSSCEGMRPSYKYGKAINQVVNMKG
jgi:hypothetical protein